MNHASRKLTTHSIQNDHVTFGLMMTSSATVADASASAATPSVRVPAKATHATSSGNHR